MKRSPEAVLGPDPQRPRVALTSTSGIDGLFLDVHDVVWCVLSPLGAAESYTLDLWWVCKLIFLFSAIPFRKCTPGRPFLKKKYFWCIIITLCFSPRF